MYLKLCSSSNRDRSNYKRQLKQLLKLEIQEFIATDTLTPLGLMGMNVYCNQFQNYNFVTRAFLTFWWFLNLIKENRFKL